MPYIYSPLGPHHIYRSNQENQYYYDPDFLVLGSDEIIVEYVQSIAVPFSGSYPPALNGFLDVDFRPDHFVSGFFDLSQRDPSLTLLSDGNVLVSWVARDFFGPFGVPEYEVAFTIADADGNIVVAPQLGNSHIMGAQTAPVTQALDGGGFVMAWSSEEQDGSGEGVFARIFAADGQTIAAEFQVNQTTAGDQTLSEVVIGADGRILVTWTSGDAFFVRLFSATGAPLGEEISLGTAAGPDASIVALPGGGFIAALSGDGLDTSGSGIVIHKLSADGVLLGSPIEVNTTTTGDQDAARVLVLANGGFAVIWESEGQDGSGTGILARFFDADGTPATDELQINQTTAGNQFDLDAAQLPNGDIVISWTSDGPLSTIQARSLSADGTFLGDEFAALPGSQYNQVESEIQVFSDSSFQITWSSTLTLSREEGGIFGQNFVQDQVGTGVPLVQGVARPGEVLTADISTLADPDGLDLSTASYRWLRDGAVVSRQDTYAVGPGNFGTTIVVEVTVTDGLGISQTYTSQPTAPIGSAIFASAGDDDLSGTVGGDLFDGGAGNDIIRGLAGDDSLFGGLADDYLHGGANDDLVTGDAGNDTLFGGFQEDTLIGGTGNDLILGDAGFDVLIGGTGNDTLNGGAQADVLLGGDGDDFLIGEVGLDILSGDAGNDTLRGDGGADVLRGGGNDDELLAGEGNDILYGDDGNDAMQGDAGFDLLVGGIGNDTLDGGDNNDTLLGGAGFDRLSGGAGADQMDGGDQADNLLGGDGNDTMLGGNGFDRLFGQNGDDFLFGGYDTDGLYGQSGNDTILGQWGNDLLDGGTGNDVLDGGANDDRLSGGAGFDILIGSLGNDTLTGNFNADTFVFADNHGKDIITDFDAANALERIDLSAIVAITSYLDLTLNHLSQVGENVEINTGSGLVTLLNVELADLDEGDFLL